MQEFDLGSYSRTITTSSPAAQHWFDLGLNWCYAFNRFEGVKCFRKALEYDPHCVMAHWGIAYGSGPFYNLTWRDFGPREASAATATAYAHIEAARALASYATELERQLVEAQAARVQQPHAVSPDEYDRWDDAYAAKMREIAQRHPHDSDVAALSVEALIQRTPRRLWDVRTGQPAQGSDVMEALDICERALALAEQTGSPKHPALLHLHIHCLEMSDEPERAMPSALALGPLCPDAGHLNHMPAHIYMLVGQYERVLQASARAIAANDRFLAYAGKMTPYTTACAHDLLLMMHAGMFAGRYQDAVFAAEKLHDLITREALSVQDRPKFATSLEGYCSMRTHVMVRFGRWHDIIAEPLPDDPDLYLVTTAMGHYAKGIAYATLKDFALAEQHKASFYTSVERISPERKVFNNSARAVLAVAEKMLDGEVAYHQGHFDTAFASLRDAVERDDNLEYVEPWAWMHPPRHALAALLAEQGQFEEAEQVYRDDLGLTDRVQRCAQHPDNIWALHGLVECVERRGVSNELELLTSKLKAAASIADVPINSSCMCRTRVIHGTRHDCCG